VNDMQIQPSGVGTNQELAAPLLGDRSRCWRSEIKHLAILRRVMSAHPAKG